MRRLGLVLALLLTPPLLLFPGSPARADEAVEVEAAYIKVALTRDGQTFAHPGYRVSKHEQGVFVIECEGKAHEVAVLLHEGSSERLRVTVEYSVDGRSVLTQELSVAAGEDVELDGGKTKLAINVDPQGSKDTSRKDGDKIDGPDSEDPLGGV